MHPPRAPASAAATPVGAFVGTTASGEALEIFLLHDGRLHGIAKQNPAASDIDLLQGEGQIVGHAFESTKISRYAINLIDQGPMRLQRRSDGTLEGELAVNGLASTVKADIPPTGNYVFDTPADIAKVVGDWEIAAPSVKYPTRFRVEANGRILPHKLAVPFCTMAGHMAARSDGSNVFDLYLRFGSKFCPAINKPLQGIAVLEHQTAGDELLLLGRTDNGKRGIALVARPASSP